MTTSIDTNLMQAAAKLNEASDLILEARNVWESSTHEESSALYSHGHQVRESAQAIIQLLATSLDNT